MTKSGSDGERGARSVRVLTQGQRAYETRRAQEAGVTLEAWMTRKARAAAAAAPARRPAGRAPEGQQKGRLARLRERAHRPI